MVFINLQLMNLRRVSLHLFSISVTAVTHPVQICVKKWYVLFLTEFFAICLCWFDIDDWYILCDVVHRRLQLFI